MEPELEYNGRRFKIGTDSKFGMNWGAFHPDHNSLGMKELTAVQDIKEYIVGREGT
jgi:hypothetical protein